MIATEMTKKELLADLRRRGVVKVTIPFSGGNDEGGPDGVVAVTADGTQVELPDSNAHQSTTYEKDRGWVKGDWEVYERTAEGGYQPRPATPDEITAARLRDALTKPIYDEYGGFAGEFDVTGTLTWDVEAGTCEMHGDIGYTTYEGF